LSSAKDKIPQTIRTLKPQPEQNQQESSLQTPEKDVEKETPEPEHDQQESCISFEEPLISITTFPEDPALWLAITENLGYFRHSLIYGVFIY
jgi:hypothetical protein